MKIIEYIKTSVPARAGIITAIIMTFATLCVMFPVILWSLAFIIPTIIIFGLSVGLVMLWDESHGN